MPSVNKIFSMYCLYIKTLIPHLFVIIFDIRTYLEENTKNTIS